MRFIQKWCLEVMRSGCCACVFQPLDAIALDVLIRAKVFVVSYERITCE